MAEPAGVRAILLDDLVARQPLLAAINLVLAGIVGVAFWPVIGGAVIGLWLAAMAAAQIARLAIWRQLRDRPAALRRGAWLTLASALAGLAWGLGGLLLFQAESPAHQVFLPFVLAGMVAGAVISLPAHTPTFYAFFVPALLPYAIRLGVEPEPLQRAMGLTTLLFGLGIGLVGLQLHRTMSRSIHLGQENAALVRTLERARDELERRVEERTRDLRAANSRLVEEVAERRRSEARVRHLLHHDALTGLPNRLLFQDRLAQALVRARRSGERVAVILLDLDRFKEINDSRGHPVGDRLLRAVAERLRRTLRAADTLARLGGDEFAVVAGGLAAAEAAAGVAAKLLAALDRPLELDGETVHSGVSIGISLFPEHGADADSLTTHADLALYAAKEQRRCFRLFTPSLREAMQARRRLDEELRTALEEGQFVLHYQPRFDLAGGRMTGVEALLRWRHPEHGLLGPDRFIGAAEASGLIRPIGRWVLEEACRQGAAWAEGGRRLAVSVNLSPAQFAEDALAQEVRRALDDSRLAARALELEVTETLYLEHASERIYALMHALRLEGIRLSIDDFGTGYSSLAYLRHLPFDIIKIDRAFVSRLGDAPEDEAIVRAVVTLVHALGKRVVAEGVETPAQLDILRALECDEAQGYLLARPAAAAAI
jgi:diguanylate cyclase (GGDEF)-like protein